MGMVESQWPEVRFAVIGEAWRLYKRHWGVWSIAMLLVMIVYGAVAGLLFSVLDVGHARGPGGFRPFVPSGQGAIHFILSTTVSLFFAGGMIRMASNQVRGRAPRVEDLFSITDVWFDLLLVSLLYAVGSFIGSVLCVIPGLIVAGVWMLAVPLVVEGKLPATGAVIQSWHALKSQWLNATVFNLLLIILSFSGAILCGIGLLFTGPLYSLSIALVYRSFFPVPPSTAKKTQVDPFPEI
jgi:hypothetical protein